MKFVHHSKQFEMMPSTLNPVFKPWNDKVDLIRTGCGNGWIDVSYLSDYFLKMYPPLTSEENKTPGLARNRSVNVHAMHNTVQQNQACTVTQGKGGSQLNDDKWRAIYLHLPSIPLFHTACCCLRFYNRALVKLDNKEGCDRNLPKTLTYCQKEELTTVLNRIPATQRGWFVRLSIHTLCNSRFLHSLILL